MTAPDATDLATWSPDRELPDPPIRTGRTPRMTWLPWMRNQRTELGATAVHEHYWRCLNRGCRRWCGPYPDAWQAKDEGTAHDRRAH